MRVERCVVTGGAGFIGSHLVDRLIAAEHPVAVIDNLSTGNSSNLNPKAEFHDADIRDPKAIAPLVAGAQWVFHAAAWPRIQPSFDDPVTHEAINVTGAINVLTAARDAGVERFLYFGSSAVYGTPDTFPTGEDAPIRCYNPYALQKYAAEQYCLMLGRRWGIAVVSLRIFNVYGPRSYDPARPNSAYSPVVGVFHHQRTNGQPLTITGTGEQSRDFVHVADVAGAFIETARSTVSDAILNVGSGHTVSINDIAKMMSAERVYVPERPHEAVMTQANIARIRETVGWEPTITLADGLRLLD
jgi:UDP-glucose 4-epimerase